MLDAGYLQLERFYRCLYDDVRHGKRATKAGTYGCVDENFIDSINYLIDDINIRRPTHVTTDAQQIDSVRAFNRFYTRQIGLLGESIHQSTFSLTEARVLYELAQRDGLTATALGRELKLDAGYLSRILTKFETRGLLTRSPSTSDGRQMILALTQEGRIAFTPLNQASQDQTAGMLEQLSPSQRATLVQSMRNVMHLLGGGPQRKVSYVLRGLQSGDIGWVVHRQGTLYAQEYGFDETFEAMAAEILGAFVKNFDVRNECCWIAECEREIAGSIFLIRESDNIARLRLLYVEPWARGLGIGCRLVDECVRFARARGYQTLTLWTNDILISARRIYEAAGFKLMREEHHHSFSKDLVGQHWDLRL